MMPWESLGLDVALLGDLQEERAQGRSAIWYWRQIVIAICSGVWGTLRDHKVLAARAAATGFAVELCFLFLWNRYSPLLPDWPMLSLANTVFNFSLVLLTQAVTGWVVARTHRPHQLPMVLLFLTCDLLWWTQRSLPFLRIVLIGSISQPGYRPYLAWYLIDTLFLVAGVLIGGILGARTPKPQLQQQPSPPV